MTGKHLYNSKLYIASSNYSAEFFIIQLILNCNLQKITLSLCYPLVLVHPQSPEISFGLIQLRHVLFECHLYVHLTVRYQALTLDY